MIGVGYGRPDCGDGSSPYTEIADPTATTNPGTFPDPRWGYANVSAWCLSEFNMNPQECTAIMGEDSKVLNGIIY